MVLYCPHGLPVFLVPFVVGHQASLHVCQLTLELVLVVGVALASLLHEYLHVLVLVVQSTLGLLDPGQEVFHVLVDIVQLLTPHALLLGHTALLLGQQSHLLLQLLYYLLSAH